MQCSTPSGTLGRRILRCLTGRKRQRERSLPAVLTSLMSSDQLPASPFLTWRRDPDSSRLADPALRKSLPLADRASHSPQRGSSSLQPHTLPKSEVQDGKSFQPPAAASRILGRTRTPGMEREDESKITDDARVEDDENVEDDKNDSQGSGQATGKHLGRRDALTPGESTAERKGPQAGKEGFFLAETGVDPAGQRRSDGQVECGDVYTPDLRKIISGFPVEADLSESGLDSTSKDDPGEAYGTHITIARNLTGGTSGDKHQDAQELPSYESTLTLTSSVDPFEEDRGRESLGNQEEHTQGVREDLSCHVTDTGQGSERSTLHGKSGEVNIRALIDGGNLHAQGTDVNTPTTVPKGKSPFQVENGDEEDSGENTDLESQGTPGGDVIVVTGGAGFLGRHVVRLLQEHADHVAEIRVLDLVPFQPFGDDRGGHTVTSIVGSVTDEAAVRKVCRGANSVIHVAGLVSYGTFPDVRGMEHVNVDGTLTVLRACLRESVSRLLFCSTVDVVIGQEDIEGGTEELLPPDVFLFPGYPATKQRAESLVLVANGQTLDNGRRLRTIALRANVMYGEGDPYYVTSGLRSAKQCGGYLLPVEGSRPAIFQAAYAGNTAWAFLCAERALRADPRLGGQALFVPDHTPLGSTFALMAPYLAARGMALAPVTLPFRPLYWLLRGLEALLSGLAPLVRVHKTSTSHSLQYVTMRLWFRGDRAQSLLGYRPLFTPKESRDRSLAYYSRVKL